MVDVVEKLKEFEHAFACKLHELRVWLFDSGHHPDPGPPPAPPDPPPPVPDARPKPPADNGDPGDETDRPDPVVVGNDPTGGSRADLP